MTYKYFLICSQQIKEDNLPPYWSSNLRTPVCEANALPLTPQQTVIQTYYDFKNISFRISNTPFIVLT